MKKNLIFLALAAIGFASCNGGFKQGPNGLLYNLHKEAGSAKIKKGDFIAAYLVVKTDGDSLLYSAYESGQPQFVIVQDPQFKGDFMDGLTLVGQGDSATFKISTDSIFKGGVARPPYLKSTKYLLYDVKVEKVIPKGTLSDEVFQRTVSTYVHDQTENAKKQEPAKIKKYIDDNKLQVAKTDSGLYYVITKPGSGPNIAVNDTAVVNYTGRLLNGKIFDTSIKEDAIKGKMPELEMRSFQPIRIPVGRQGVIKGWDLGLPLLNKGAKATFVIPSNLAYGDRGNQAIAPNSPLVFDIEVVDIVRAPALATK